MRRLRISHTTAYRYSEPVSFGIHRLVIRPREGHDLQVENLSLKVSPAAAVSWHRDIFGNSIALASFSEPADMLEFSSEAVVCRRDHTSHRRLLDVLPIKFPVQYSEIEASVAGGYLESVYRTENEELREWAEATFALNSGDDAVLLVETMNEWIHRVDPLSSARRSRRAKPTRDFATGKRFLPRHGYLTARSGKGAAPGGAFCQRLPRRHRLTGWSGRDPRLG